MLHGEDCKSIITNPERRSSFLKKSSIWGLIDCYVTSIMTRQKYSMNQTYPSKAQSGIIGDRIGNKATKKENSKYTLPVSIWNFHSVHNFHLRTFNQNIIIFWGLRISSKKYLFWHSKVQENQPICLIKVLYLHLHLIMQSVNTNEP